MTRRSALKLLGAGAGLTVSPALQRCRVPEQMRDPFYGSRWPGHQPGSIYLGVSRAGLDLSGATRDLGPLGAHRSFFGWYDIDLEISTIRADLVAGRLPWVSFKPPREGPGAWLEVASGARDEDLRRRAEAYDVLDGPVVVTFSHEPVGDPSGTPEDYAAAFSHVHDVMDAASGLRSVAFAPVLNDWAFNPRNPIGRPLDYLTPLVLDRSAFVGIDLYQNSSGETFQQRLPRIVETLAVAGRADLMLGIGETGCSDRLAGGPSAEAWWNACWDWATTNPQVLGAVCYFDSVRNSKSGTYWPLDESAGKQAAFQASLESASSCRLPSYWDK